MLLTFNVIFYKFNKRFIIFMKTLPIFEFFPELEGQIPWKSLGPLKTPVQELFNLEDHFNNSSLWVKQSARLMQSLRLGQ